MRSAGDGGKESRLVSLDDTGASRSAASTAVLRPARVRMWQSIDMRRRGHRFHFLQEAPHDEARRPELL